MSASSAGMTGPAALAEVERDLHDLTLRHARLRSELEERFSVVRDIEDRFVALRPHVDTGVQQELRRKMVLSRPWREELDLAYQALLATTNEMAALLVKIHECQTRAAQMVAAGGGPSFPPVARPPDRGR